MKTVRRLAKASLYPLLPICSSLCLALMGQQAGAAIISWDPNGTTSIGGNGTWDLTTPQWSPTSTQQQTNAAALVAWIPGDAALFSAGPSAGTSQGTFTITVNTANISMGGIYNGSQNPGSDFVTIVGSGSFSLPTGTATFSTGGTVLGSTTIAIPINGVGPLQNTFGGPLTLAAANNYTGGTIINGVGGISFSNNSAFGTGAITWSVSGFIQPAGSSAYTIANPMTHLLNGNESFSGGTGGVRFTGAWTLPASGTTIIDNIAGNVTVGGVIGGAAGLIVSNKSGATWTFTNVNTYSGPTVVTNGASLTIGGAGQLGSGAYAGKITNNGALIFNSSADQTLSGIISGAGYLNQLGASTLTLSAVNTFTGGVAITGGTLKMGGAGTLAVANKITNNGTFTYNSSASLSLTGGISGGGVVNVNSGTLTLPAADTYTGITTVNGGTLNIASEAGLGAAPGSFTSNQLTLNGGTIGFTATAVDINSNRGIFVASNATLSVSASQSPNIESVISGPGTLTKSTSGNLGLNNANTFSGGLTITGGGIRFNTNGAAGTGVITVSPASIITLRNLSPPGLTSVTITNDMVLNANGVNDIDLTAAAGNTFALTGSISGVGYLTRGRASGTGGTISLSGSNSFSGGLFLENGTLNVGSSNALGTGLLTIVPGGFNAAFLQASTPLTGINALTNPVNILVTNLTNFTINGSNDLELAGPIGLSNSFAPAITITNNNTGATILSGVISSLAAGNGLTVTSTNGGTLTLAGANTYSGNTTIGAGTLALSATGSINASPAISIGAGGTFDVSAYPTYTFATANFGATGSASNSAAIKGGTTADLGSEPIALNFTPTNFLGDTGHPALVVSQGALNLTGNVITVNNTAASALGVGVYTLIQVTGGTINGAPGSSVTVTGAGIAANTTAAISVSGGSVILTVTGSAPSFSNLTSSQAIQYGTTNIVLSGTLSAAGPLYPAIGEAVTITINGNAQATTISDATGDFSVNYNTTGFTPGGATSITYSYAGGPSLYSTSDASTALAVNQRSIGVVGTRPYDGSSSADYTILTITNVVSGDDVSLAGGQALLTASVVGPEAVFSGGTLILTGATAGYYTITGITGTVTISAGSLTITANSLSKNYGSTIVLGATNFSVTGTLAGSETVTDVALVATGGTAAADPVSGSPYTITPGAAVGTNGFLAANYNISYVPGTLTVNPLAVVLTGTRAYDGTSNILGSSLIVSNSVDGTNINVSGSATLSDQTIGIQALTVLTNLVLGGSAVSNYTLVGASGAVTITPLPIAVTGARAYDGTSNAAFGVLTITNVVGTDDLTASAGSVVLAGANAGVQNVADFSGLVLSGTTASNYTVTNAIGTVTITALPLAITAGAQSKTYGSTLVLGTTNFSVIGTLAGAETVTDVTLIASGGTGASDPVSGSPYAITPSGAIGAGGFLSNNYTITYATNSLTVNSLALVLTGTRAYDGTADALFSILVPANIVGGDDVVLASGSATLAGTGIGTDAIVSAGTLALGGSTAGNYTLAGVSGNVTITNPYLPFSITSQYVDNTGTNLVIVWDSVPGAIYQVLGTPDFTTWTNIGGAITASGTKTTNSSPVSGQQFETVSEK